MALGYEGYVSLNVGGTEDVALGTGGGVPDTQQRLDSSSGYGGEIKTPVAEMGIGLPHTYDWTEWNGSMEFEVHEDFLTNQVKPWIFDRQKAAVVKFKTRGGNAQQFSNCYWNNISLSASEGAVLSGSIAFVAIERDSYTRGGDYIANKEGSPTLCTTPPPYFADPLNTGSTNINPIPYWNTFVEIDSSLVPFTTWTLDFSQEVVKFFGCENNTTPQAPKYIAVGPMTVTFTGDYMFFDTATFLSPVTLLSLYVTMGGVQLKTETLELQSDADNLQSPDAIVPVSVEYAAYELVA